MPFRSVANYLLRGLSEANREAYDLHVLRPPTFEQLGKVLRQAHREGRPYHVVHFDGHGTYEEVQEPGAAKSLLGRLTSIVLAGPRAGRHGYLWFENPQLEDNGEYRHTGRRAEWKRLVEEIIPDFVDPESDGPLPGREEKWSLVTQYRVWLTSEERQWDEAERLQTIRMDWNHRRVAPALARPAKELEGAERNAIRSFMTSLHDLGQIRRELGLAECVPTYERALELCELIGERAGAATCAFNLGHAFKDLPLLCDLKQAERWYLRSLELYSENERHDRGQCLMQLGAVACRRFDEAWAAGKPEEELLQHLNKAARYYHEALDLLPADAVNDLAVAHNQLGGIYGNGGDPDRAVKHIREAVKQFETAGDFFNATQARLNVALFLSTAGRRVDALEYAEAALWGFESYGERAAEKIEKTRHLIAKIRGA